MPELSETCLLVSAAHGEDLEPLERLSARERRIGREIGQDESAQSLDETFERAWAGRLEKSLQGHILQGVLFETSAEGT